MARQCGMEGNKVWVWTTSSVLWVCTMVWQAHGYGYGRACVWQCSELLQAATWYGRQQGVVGADRTVFASADQQGLWQAVRCMET